MVWRTMTLTKPTTSRGIGFGGVCAAPALCSGFPFASYSWWSLPFSGLRSTSQSRPAFDADCCRPTWGTRISSTRCATPSCRRIGSRTSGGKAALDAARLRADTLNVERILPPTGDGRPSAPNTNTRLGSALGCHNRSFAHGIFAHRAFSDGILADRRCGDDWLGMRKVRSDC